jgi:GntR family transcriptional regulator, galactonate operon transcriptional repressor
VGKDGEVPDYPIRGLHGQVVDELGRGIVAGDLSDNGVLDLAALEQSLQVSRTVVREALKVLGAKGLVDARPKRGTFIRPRSEWNLFDRDILRWTFDSRIDPALIDQLAEVRSIIEPAAVRLAAVRRDEDDLATLRAALADMQAADDPEQITAADVAFHRALIRSAHNELLLPIQEVVLVGLRARDLAVHRVQGRQPDLLPPEAATAHQDVLEAVEKQDPNSAESAMRQLLQLARSTEAADRATPSDSHGQVA